MNIGKQIHILLKKTPEVYVKGLGVFRRIHTPATFDPHKNVYLPPVTFIEFDTTVTDGYDLAFYIQQIQQCERSEAESKVSQAVEEVKQQIVGYGQVSLDNLGRLVGYGDSYVFKPFDVSHFDLTAVEAPISKDSSSLKDISDSPQVMEDQPPINAADETNAAPEDRPAPATVEEISAIDSDLEQSISEPIDVTEESLATPEETSAIDSDLEQSISEPIDVTEESLATPEETSAIDSDLEQSIDEPIDVTEESLATPEETSAIDSDLEQSIDEPIDATEESLTTPEEISAIASDLEQAIDEPIDATEESPATPEETSAIDSDLEQSIDEPIDATEESLTTVEEIKQVYNVPDPVEHTESAAFAKTPDTNEPIESYTQTSDSAYTVEPEVPPSKSKAVIYVVIAVLVLSIAAAIFYFNRQNKTTRNINHTGYNQDASDSDTISLIDIEIDTPAKLDTNTLILNKELIDSINKKYPEEAVPVVDSIAADHRYTIVIGTHKTLAQAYEEADAFNKDGHKSVRVVTPNLAKNKKRVIWDTYRTRAERDSALRYVRKHIKSDAWADFVQ